MIKGPLSRRHNYLKSLYTQNLSSSSLPSSPSPSLSASIDSDYEMDDSVSQFSNDDSISFNEITNNSSIQADIASINDFYDARVDINSPQFENIFLNADEDNTTQDEILVNKVSVLKIN